MKRNWAVRLDVIWFACIVFALACTASAQEQESARSRLVVLAAVAPVYPPLAAQGQIGGRVAVEVVLDQSGGVRSVSILDGHPLLRSAALWAANRWKFEPGSDGRRARLMFVFSLVPADSDLNELASMFRPPYEVTSKARLPKAIVNYD